MFRSVSRILLWLFGSAVLGFAAYVGYGAYAEPRAERLASDFCSSIRVGDDPLSVLESAKRADASRAFLKWIDGEEGTRRLMIIFVGLPPFSRHVCDVTANAKVTGARYLHMD